MLFRSKEILEKYLEHLCHISGKFDGVETERKYFINKNKLLTPDILVFKEDKCLFIESKSSVIKSSFRDINNLSSEMYYINLYSENLFKLYKHIKNYRNDVFNIFDRRFDNDNCYGVLVNYEDVQISRTKIFDEFFNLIQSESIQMNGKEKKWIYNHLRIIDMYEFEKLLLFKIENNFIIKMFGNDYSEIGRAHV